MEEEASVVGMEEEASVVTVAAAVALDEALEGEVDLTPHQAPSRFAGSTGRQVTQFNVVESALTVIFLEKRR
jgi:hypothetical protein